MAQRWRAGVQLLHNEKAAKEVVSAVTEAGGRAIEVRAEMSDLGDIEALFASADAFFDEASSEVSLDILVNSAGIPMMAPIGSTTEEDYDRHRSDTPATAG